MTTRPTRLRWALIGSLVVMLFVPVLLALWMASRTQYAPPGPTATPVIPTDFAPEAVVDPPFASLTYGVHAFLWWNPTMRTYDLDNIRLAKFTHVKQQFAWANIEPLAGQWNWEQADGIVTEVLHRDLNLIARLDAPPDWAKVPIQEPTGAPVDLDAYANFCGTVAARYEGQIAGYQVWNEPNLRREWGDNPPNAAGYVSLLAACSAAIRQADPEAVVISAGLAPTGSILPEAIPDTDYLRLLYDAGVAPHFDVLGLNAPGYNDPPAVSPDEAAAKYDGHRWRVFRHVEDMRAIMVAAGDAHKQVAILEMGWTIDPRPESESSYSWHAVSEEEQAAYLVGAYEYAATHWRPWIGLMTTIYIADIAWTEDDEQYWWAINTAGYAHDWQGRAAYYELSWMARWIDDEYYPPREPGAPEVTTVDPIVSPGD